MRFTVTRKMVLMVLVLLAGFIAYQAYSTRVTSRLLVNGPVYGEIVLNKDLIADILPPPEYLIESYLVVLQMAGEDDPDRLTAMQAKCDQLRQDYMVRHQYWLDHLEAGPMRQAMVEDSYHPAIRFYDLRDTKFCPLIQAGQREQATTLAFGDLRTAYEEHRQAIDRVVEMATRQCADLEASTAATLTRNGWVMLGAALVFALGMLTVSLTVARSIVKPLRRVIVMLQDIAQGEGDLTSRLDVQRSDEIGELGQWFNTFVGKLQGVIKEMAVVARTLAGSATELSATADQLASGAEETTTQSSQVAAAAEELSASMRGMAASGEQMSANVRTTSITVEQMTASIGEIAGNAEQAARVADNATSLAQNSNDRISQLGQAADQIGKVIEVIQEIAEQTNLLALNATIEAARAGEAGKGFAVVATEVKELARQTAGATEDIRSRVEGIQSASSEAVQSLGQIIEVIGNVNSVSRSIAAAVEEQNVTTGQIAGSVAQTAQASAVVAQGVTQSASASQEIAENIVGVDSAARQTAEAAAQTRVAGQELSRLAEQLNHLVSQFKV